MVAILMSRFGTRMGIVTYATHSAKKMLQEVGITLFMAAVGLSSGKIFFTTLMEQGLSWFLMGAMITIIPVVIISLIGRFFCIKFCIKFFAKCKWRRRRLRKLRQLYRRRPDTYRKWWLRLRDDLRERHRKGSEFRRRLQLRKDEYPLLRGNPCERFPRR